MAILGFRNVLTKEKKIDKYNEVWEKVRNTIKKEFNSKLVYNKKYLKTEKKINIKESFQCICTLVILIDSV